MTGALFRVQRGRQTWNKDGAAGIQDYGYDKGEECCSIFFELHSYGDMSQRVMETLRESVPSIEIYSIDEAFLYLNGIENTSLKEFGENLVRKVGKNTGIPISVGISHTKTLQRLRVSWRRSTQGLMAYRVIWKMIGISERF